MPTQITEPMKFFTLLIVVTVALTTLHAIPPDRIVAIGSTATVTGLGNPIAFLCDSQETEDRWIEYIDKGDRGAIQALFAQHHLSTVADGAKVKIIDADASRHIFKVQVLGSTRGGWIINDCLTNVVEPKD
jgi:hypothetical protein